MLKPLNDTSVTAITPVRAPMHPSADNFAAMLRQEKSAQAGQFDAGQLREKFEQWRAGEHKRLDPMLLPADLMTKGTSQPVPIRDINQARLDAIDAAAPAFIALMERAASTGGYEDPQGFLQTLGPQDLRALRTIHGMGVDIEPAGLDREGALNLLLPHNAARDLDRDGITNIGAARTSIFPPNDAPEHVKKAWEAAVETLPAGERLMAQAAFLMMPLEHAAPGPDTDYAGLVRDRLLAEEWALRGAPASERQNREKIIGFLRHFLGGLAAGA